MNKAPALEDRPKERKDIGPRQIVLAVSNEEVLLGLHPLKEAQDGVTYVGSTKSAQGKPIAGRPLKDITNTMGQNTKSGEDITSSLASSIIMESGPSEAPKQRSTDPSSNRKEFGPFAEHTGLSNGRPSDEIYIRGSPFLYKNS